MQNIIQKNTKISQIDPRNKGLLSTSASTLEPWSQILSCSPICLALNSQFRKYFCNYCIKQAQNLRCSRCKVMYYCSTSCQEQDWKLHKMECRILGQVWAKIGGKITMDFVVNLRLWNYRRIDKKIDDQMNQMCHLIQYQLPQKLSQFQQTATILLTYLSLQPTPQSLSSLIRQQSTLSLNSFSIQDPTCSNQSLGLALYFPANFLNHDCHPNAIQIFDGRDLRIFANRRIQNGEEIVISYVGRVEEWGVRRGRLRDGYLFQCFCGDCQIGRMFDWGIMYVNCPQCGQPNVKDTNKYDKLKLNISQQQQQQQQSSSSKPPNYKCLSCQTPLSPQSLSSIVSQANSHLQALSSPDYSLCKKSLLQLRKLISLSDPRFQSCLHHTYLLALGEEKYDQAYILLKEMVDNMPKWYRLEDGEAIPYVYIWRYSELGKLAYNLNKMKKACQYTEKAYEIVEKIKFKCEFQELKQLKQRYQQMKIGLSFNKAEIFRKKL